MGKALQLPLGGSMVAEPRLRCPLCGRWQWPKEIEAACRDTMGDDVAISFHQTDYIDAITSMDPAVPPAGAQASSEPHVLRTRVVSRVVMNRGAYERLLQAIAEMQSKIGSA